MTATGADTIVGRYVLDDQVADSAGSTMWHGRDPVLGRSVGIRLLSADDPRAGALHEAACLASQVTDRHLVRVLDVLTVSGHVGRSGRPAGTPPESSSSDGGPLDLVAVVTEWVPGRPFSEFLGEPLAPLEATRVALEIARCLQAAHATGLAHGRIRPNSLLVTDIGDVKLRGLGVEAVLWGCQPVPEPAAADIAGVGALLYAGLTGRWPYGGADGVPAAPILRTDRHGNAVLPPPGNVVPSIPPLLDDLISRCVPGVPAVAHRGTGGTRGRRQTPGTRESFTTMAALAASLTVAVDQLRGNQAHAGEVHAPLAEDTRTGRRRRRGARFFRRAVGVVAGLLVIAGLVLGGVALVNSAPSPVAERQTNGTAPTLEPGSTSGPSPTPEPTADAQLDVVGGRDFDPLGPDNSENPSRVGDAFDGDPSTSWTTERYSAPELSGKGGVGIVLDLGSPRPISSVTVDLLGRGTTLEIRTATRNSDDPADYRAFGRVARGAGDSVLFRPVAPVVARYVLVWLRDVPVTSGGDYRGGIAEVQIRGGGA